jgi:(1->4)-alpha-D-glucan 1-alpha-D-glucosylmutase
MREAKQHTTWNDPVDAYESRVLELAADCLESERLTTLLAETVAAHQDEIAAVTLASKLIALTLPGVPDTYQGCESVALDLVDPDNRRPVDYPALQQRLVRLDAQGGGHDDQLGHEPLTDAKLRVTARTLRLRRDCPELFGTAADYRPIPSAPEVIAFARSCGAQSVVTAVHTRGGELDSGTIELPEGRWLDVLTARDHDGGRQTAAQLFRSLPVALLVREGPR